MNNDATWDMYHYNLLIKKLGFNLVTELKGIIIPKFENFHLGLWADSMVPKFYLEKFNYLRKYRRSDDKFFTLPVSTIDVTGCVEFVPSKDRWRMIQKIMNFKYLLKIAVNYNKRIK
jgi:hypothetical protein